MQIWLAIKFLAKVGMNNGNYSEADLNKEIKKFEFYVTHNKLNNKDKKND